MSSCSLSHSSKYAIISLSLLLVNGCASLPSVQGCVDCIGPIHQAALDAGLDRFSESDLEKALGARDITRAGSESNDFREIWIERTNCLGSCPSYSRLFTSDLHAIHYGFSNTALLGCHQATLFEDEFQLLARIASEIDFQSFAPNYPFLATDAPTTYTRVVTNAGNVHTVKNYSNAGPVELWLFEKFLDSFSKDIEWTSRPEATMEECFGKYVQLQ